MRRLWIDAPYVLPKALLIDAVAREPVPGCPVGADRLQHGDRSSARSCRCRVVVDVPARAGERGDVALRAAGGLPGRLAHDFLPARLSRVVRDPHRRAAARGGPPSRPRVLQVREARPRPGAHRAEQVAAAADELFPDTTARTANISNARGWVAGRAAADLASLDVRDAVPRRPARGAAAELRGFRHQRCSPVANRLSRAAACPRSAATRRPRPWTSRAALGRAGRRSRARTRAEPLRRWLPRSTNGRPTARVARRR